MGSARNQCISMRKLTHAERHGTRPVSDVLIVENLSTVAVYLISAMEVSFWSNKPI